MVLLWYVGKSGLHTPTSLLMLALKPGLPASLKPGLHSSTSVLTLTRRLVTNTDTSLSVLEVRGCGEKNTRCAQLHMLGFPFL